MKNKEFDAVKLMRDIRDNMSEEFSKLTLKEEMEILEKNLLSSQWIKSIIDKQNTLIQKEFYNSKVAEKKADYFSRTE